MSAQVFHPSTNSIARVSIIVGILLAALVPAGAAIYIRSDFYNRIRDPLPQPVPFSHQRHVAGNGLDCRYCHTSVEDSAFAGIPPTETCMTCHSVVLAGTSLIEPIEESWQTNTPIVWNRVNDLPEYAFINHSIHIKKGVGCVTCHGPVNEMRLTWREHTLQMEWCLNCHRNPEQYLQPREEVFNMNYEKPKRAGQYKDGKQLAEEYHVDTSQLTSCSTCHR
jgi:hypothetical protein